MCQHDTDCNRCEAEGLCHGEPKPLFYTCPHCHEHIFQHGRIDSLVCPKCRGYLSVLHGILVKWGEDK